MTQRLKVAMIAAENAPYSKVGGLGDVVSSLSKALRREGLDVRTVSPLYSAIRSRPLRRLGSLGPIPLGGAQVEGAAYVDESDRPALNVFIENRHFFDRPGIYGDPGSGQGYGDNFERFCFFSKACLEFFRRVNWIPDVIHCHDFHTALVPALIRTGNRTRPGTATLFTIHNLAHQGVAGVEKLALTGLPGDQFYWGGPFEFYGSINLMKAGLTYADLINTVSARYAEEIQSEDLGCGLDGVLRERRQSLFGILNGIDIDEWNPLADPHLFANYSSHNLSGKSVNKKMLREVCGLPQSDVPLIGMVSRLDAQKGFDLLLELGDRIGEMNAQWVFLGQGSPQYQSALVDLRNRFPERFSVNFEYDNPLCHQIEAGSDLFLMPSRFEPCGLNQMYSMRYGTAPLVRHTGGLADTVGDFDPMTHRGTGFKFYEYNPAAFMDCLQRAIHVWQDRSAWNRLVVNDMNQDFSWRTSARKYVELYRLAQANRGAREALGPSILS